MFAQAAVLLEDNGPPVFAGALIASFPHLLEARCEMGPPVPRLHATVTRKWLENESSCFSPLPHAGNKKKSFEMHLALRNNY